MSVRVALSAVLAVMMLAGCTGGDPARHPSSANDWRVDAPKCEDESDRVTLKEDGWSVSKSVLTGYVVNYAAIFQADTDVAVSYALIEADWFDEAGKPIDLEQDGGPQDPELTTPQSDGVFVGSSWVRLAKKPAEVKFTVGQVCWWPTDSKSYGTADVTDSGLTTKNDERALEIDVESDFDRKVINSYIVVLRNDDGKIIGGTNSDWGLHKLPDIKPGHTHEVVKFLDWNKDYIDGVLGDRDAVSSGDVYLRLGNNRMRETKAH